LIVIAESIINDRVPDANLDAEMAYFLPYIKGKVLKIPPKKPTDSPVEIDRQLESFVPGSPAIPSMFKSIEELDLPIEWWDVVPGFARARRKDFCVFDQGNLRSRASILLRVLPNLKTLNFQDTGQTLQNLATVASILFDVPKLELVRSLPLAEDLGSGDENKEYDSVLKEGSNVLQKLLFSGVDGNEVAVRTQLNQLLEMFAKYGRRASAERVLENASTMGLGLGLLAGVALNALVAAKYEGEPYRYRTVSETYGAEPPVRILLAMSVGALLGAYLEHRRRSGSRAKNTDKIFTLIFYGQTVFDRLKELLSDERSVLEEEYQKFAVGTYEPRPPSTIIFERRRASSGKGRSSPSPTRKTRSPSRNHGSKKKKKK
jgi:hypothetical protein